MSVEVALIFTALLLTILINAFILAGLMRRVQDQGHDTQALAVINRSLENRVDRLATAVDQSLQQLRRALELSSSVHLLIYNKLRNPDYPLSDDDMGRISTHLLELKAIAVVNGDTELIDRVLRLRDAVDLVLNPPPEEDERPRRQLDVSEATEGVQRKVYALLADATRVRQ
jgi:hypothetical protein